MLPKYLVFFVIQTILFIRHPLDKTVSYFGRGLKIILSKEVCLKLVEYKKEKEKKQIYT